MLMQTAVSTAARYGRMKNFINGSFVPSDSVRTIPVISPLDGAPLADMPCSTLSDLDAAVTAARNAFAGWSRTPVKERVQVLFRYRNLLERDKDQLVALVSEENGKTPGEALAEIEKCIELTEFA